MEPLFSNELLATALQQASSENSSNELLALLLRECYTSFSRNELLASLARGSQVIHNSNFGVLAVVLLVFDA